ncbi:MAG: methyltransferase [Gammaproteobacteria bacterium]
MAKRMLMSYSILAGCLLAIGAAAGDQSAAETRLTAVLDAQPDDVKARYDARHPHETLTFFGIEPGMTVYEALPGPGWYSKILSAYLGSGGNLVGIDYPYAMYPMFNFYDDAFLEAKKSWVSSWPEQARAWHGADGADIDAFLFGAMPDAMAGQADAVLLIRALHNLARFEAEGGYLSTALADIHRALKPGGVVGVVQHMAPEAASDAWADGSNGYLKKSFVIKRFEDAGFEFVGASDVNRNPADQPTEQDYVWRLPPVLSLNDDNEANREQYVKIGESNRMTLRFRKP